MIIALSLIILGLISVLVIAHQLERAPEAFEDDQGFHFRAPRTSMTTHSTPPPMANAGEVIG